MVFDAGAIVSSLTMDRSDFTRGIAAARAEGAKGVSVPVRFDISQQSVTRATTASKRLFAASPVTVAVTFGISQASVTKALTASRSLFAAKPMTVPVGFSVSQASVTRALGTARALFAARPLVVPVTFSVTAASVARTVAQAKSLFAANPVNVKVTFTAAGAAAAAAGAASVAGATNAAAAAGRGAYGVWGLLTKQLTLFGGALDKTGIHMLTQVSVLHLGIDWVIEFSAVLIPATIAVTAFGVAAAGTLVSIYTHLQSVSTVSKATGEAIAPLTGGFAKLQAAVKPQVYQLYGDALTLLSSKSGTMAAVTTATGSALDYLGARMTVAITAGKGMGGIMSAGATDVAKLGDIVGNFGGVLGNLLKAMPGYAEIFLNLWDVVSKGAEAVTAVTVPVLHVGLALHGLIIYGGLAVTAVLALRAPMTALALGAVKAGAGIVALGAEMIATAASGDVLAAAMLLVDATGGPVVWIAAAVVALGALVVWMARSKDATESWVGSLQKGIQSAPLASVIRDIGSAQVQVTGQLYQATQKLASTQEYVNTVNLHTGVSSRTVTAAYLAQEKVVTQLRSANADLSDQASLYNHRLNVLGQTYGSNANAEGLLVTAGITTKQMLDKNSNAWAIIQQQVAATSLAYKDMGITGGVLGNDMQVLSSQVTQQYTAIQKLNSGLDAFIGNVTKTQSSFDTYAQGLTTLAQAPAKAAASLASAQASAASAQSALSKLQASGTATASQLAAAQDRVTAAQGKLSLAQSAGKASVDGLSQASITLNQNYTTSIGNIQAMLDSWRQAGVAQNLQTQGTKDAIEPLLKYAAGSREATAQLVALAEQAGYNGPASLKILTAWLGKTHDATQAVKNITDQATIQEALLTTSMQAQGSYIANKLIGDINNAILQYNGVAKAATAYGNAIAQGGRQSDAAQAARTALINDLIRTGKEANDTKGQIAAMITKVTGIPLRRALQIVVTGEGSYHLTETQKIIGSLGGSTGLPPRSGKASGGVITGGVPGRDSVPIMAMPGEVVVPTSMVKSGAVDHLRGRLPGFAAGGVVGSYSGKAPGEGKWVVSEYDKSVTAIEKSVAGATAAAIRSALKAAASIIGTTTTAIGDLPANWRPIATFLTGHGYSHTGASGIAGNILQESGGSPESVGDGGGGLIGWTPLRAGLVTGNPGRDLATQLNAILAYNNAQGGISTLNAQPTAAAAAAYYMSHFERPAVATENAERREAGANAVFKAMGYASGTTGARPGWAKVGENGQELVHFHGGETVLPNSVTSRVLSAGVMMPGYAGGTIGKTPVLAPPKLPGPISPYPPSGGGKRAKDEAQLKKLQDQLAALEKKATAHLKELRLPIDREQLYLLQHPGISDAKKKQLEAQISKQESAVSKYRKGTTSDEGKLDKEITLLKKIIAGDPRGKTPVGNLPPGIGKMTQKQDLALLAKDVTALTALKKAATAKLKTLRKPVQEDELYLLTHPGLSAGKKAAVEAALKKAQSAVSAYRKKVTGEEDTYSKEISLLRTLTGNPTDPKYGGAGSTDSGSGDGGGAGSGTTTSGPPPGQFVGTLPAAPGQGGSTPSGGGTGGLGGSTPLGLPGYAASLPSQPDASSWSAPAAVPGGDGAMLSVGSGASGGYGASTGASSGAAPHVGPMASGSSNIERILTQILHATRQAPAVTGAQFGQTLNGASRSAYSSAMWNSRT